MATECFPSRNCTFCVQGLKDPYVYLTAQPPKQLDQGGELNVSMTSFHSGDETLCVKFTQKFWGIRNSTLYLRKNNAELL